MSENIPVSYSLMIKENKKRLILILLGLLLLAGWFYWFQWRPVKIRSYCHKWVVDLLEEPKGKEKETKRSLIDRFYPEDEEEVTPVVQKQNFLKTSSEKAIRAYEAFYNQCLHEKGLK